MPIVAASTPAGLLRCRHRGLPHRAQVPHAGVPALRRLPGQRRRAVEAARRRLAARHLHHLRHRAQRHQRRRRPGAPPYERDPDTLARAWALPGTPGLEHRIGGLEKADGRATSATTRSNHELMTHLRQAKIDGIAKDIPPMPSSKATPTPTSSWSVGARPGVRSPAASTGSAPVACKVARIHLTHLHPFPPNLGELLGRLRPGPRARDQPRPALQGAAGRVPRRRPVGSARSAACRSPPAEIEVRHPRALGVAQNGAAS